MDITKCQLELPVWNAGISQKSVQFHRKNAGIGKNSRVKQALKKHHGDYFSIVGQHPFKEVVFLRKVNR